MVEKWRGCRARVPRGGKAIAALVQARQKRRQCLCGTTTKCLPPRNMCAIKASPCLYAIEYTPKGCVRQKWSRVGGAPTKLRERVQRHG